jgi:adenylate kinase family enzyme
MILSTDKVVEFLTGKTPINVFLIGPAGAGKTYLARELIKNLVRRCYIELYVDRDYSYHEYMKLIKKFNAEIVDIKRGDSFKSDGFIKPINLIFRIENPRYKLVIVDDMNRLIEKFEEFIKKLHKDKYYYILLFQGMPDNIQKLSRFIDYIIISPRRMFEAKSMYKIKRFTWLIISCNS